MTTIDQQIASVKREIALRKNVYPKWVSNERMRQAEADHEIAAMTAALHTLLSVKRLRETLITHRGEGVWCRTDCGEVIEATSKCGCGHAVMSRTVEGATNAWIDHVFERSKAAAEAEATS